MLDSEGSCRIIGMNYSTQGLNDTSHLKTARLRGFRNYGHELLNSSTFMGIFRWLLSVTGFKGKPVLSGCHGSSLFKSTLFRLRLFLKGVV
uniref:Uncharacterized protein n=1 Tax=Solanum tuberosum TaxID=4113 RepID=M1E1C2_SOLTU